QAAGAPVQEQGAGGQEGVEAIDSAQGGSIVPERPQIAEEAPAKRTSPFTPGPKTRSVAVPPPAGTVRFSSFPPLADVYLDGERIGNTQQVFEKEFPPGEHVFTFSIPGYRSAEVRVSLDPGETASAHHRFPPFRSFTITARPFGRVLVDGTDYGDTPQTIKLSYGEHRVQVTKEGYRPEELTITIGRDTKNSAHFELNKEEKE
ncbi:MAG: PEGA domain-containing protein, partial [Candidatus Aminicenantes bacterium]|nr:PEGA domain-containing protein [Candidatus Aminicenantes bacterium]